MADDDSRPDLDPPTGSPVDPSEGVRIIKPGEAAEAVERGSAVRRRGSDEPKYGDRPEVPGGPRPSLRFPLDDATDPGLLVRPRLAPVEPRPEGGDDAEGPDDEDAPVLSVPTSGSVELPHWTEPATGEVPKIVLGDEDAEAARWAAFADQGPRWRDQSGDWEGDDADSVATIGDAAADASSLGALDTSERPSTEEFLTFGDLDVPRQPLPTAPARGSIDDPIRISTEPSRSSAAAAAAGTGRRASGATRAGGRATRRGPGEPPPQGPRHAAEPPPPSGRDVPTAVFVGVAIAAAAVCCFLLGAAATMVLVFAILALAGAEFFTATRRGGFRPATLLGLTAVAALPLATYWRGEPAIPLVLFLTVVFGLLWFILGLGPDATINMGVTLLGTVYVGVLGSFAALILKIPSQGVSILLVAVVAAVAYDVGGFAVGRQLGRTPLSSVSPNKTVEGLVAGVIASVLGVLIAAVLLGFGPFSTGQAFVFGVMCAIAAPIGDLAESVLKRDLGLKDMGSLLPGHGGVLDRFDALLFVLPTAYYVARALHLVPGL
jgi:phosphatidate cytidylyltransferase